MTQVGNAIAFGDQYNVGQTLFAGATGGLIGGATGFYTTPKGFNPWTGQKLPSAGVNGQTANLGNIAQGRYEGPDYIHGADDLDVYKSGQPLTNSPEGVVVRASGNGGGRIPLRPTHHVTKTKGEMKKLVKDIKANGIQNALPYVEENGVRYLVGGHHRYYAAQKLGILDIPLKEVSLPFAGYKTSADLIMAPGKHPGYWKYFKP